jgi:stearoyl-CoA desaturase (delta-9 desaturase)
MQNKKRSSVALSIARWFDSYAGQAGSPPSGSREIDWLRVIPFLASHLMILAVFWVGWSWTAVGIAALLYGVRMFAVTAFYHRYFSHKTFKTSRPWQFVFGLLGNSAVQRGPIWWASHHRYHHQHADQDDDIHSPIRQGFWWSHVGWLVSKENFFPRTELVGDWVKFPELRWLDRFDVVVPVVLAVLLFLLGAFLESAAPALHTSGPQLLVWGFFISTVILFHATATINSLCHMAGTKRYITGDESRNNWALALLTLGEGWHNNHHHFAASTRQGFYWWEVDLTYYLLVLLSRLGIVRDLRPVTEELRRRDRIQPCSSP